MDDYYAADLFRSHGNRGSTYLFLRWCVDRFGPDLLPALVHSNMRGAANLEACTGATFRGLYRGWTLNVVDTQREAITPSEGAVRRSTRGREHAVCATVSSRGGPRLTRLSAGSVDRWPALGTTSHYMIIDGSPSGAVEIEVSGPAGAELQVTAVVLGDDRPRLDLSVVKLHGADGKVFLRAHIKERHGQKALIEQIAWEPISPGPRRHDNAVCRGRLESKELERCLGTAALPAMGEQTSQPIPLVGASGLDEPLLVKVGAVDSKGRRIWAWAELAP